MFRTGVLVRHPGLACIFLEVLLRRSVEFLPAARCAKIICLAFEHALRFARVFVYLHAADGIDRHHPEMLRVLALEYLMEINRTR